MTQIEESDLINLAVWDQFIKQVRLEILIEARANTDYPIREKLELVTEVLFNDGLIF